MSIVTVRDFAGSEEASGVSTRGIELFAWVRAGGGALGPCAGYEAATAAYRAAAAPHRCVRDLGHGAFAPRPS